MFLPDVSGSGFLFLSLLPRGSAAPARPGVRAPPIGGQDILLYELVPCLPKGSQFGKKSLKIQGNG